MANAIKKNPIIIIPIGVFRKDFFFLLDFRATFFSDFRKGSLPRRAIILRPKTG